MTKRALLIGVSGGGITASLAAERMIPALRALGFASIESCSDRKATRAGILASLDRLIRECGPDDAVFIHYFGHGGRVQFTELANDSIFGYVTCTKQLRGSFEAVLDLELSRALTELDARCGNVTILLDCCFSAELVRSGEDTSAGPPPNHLEVAAPDWAKPLFVDRVADQARSDLALDSHPRIVRLCGASPKRTAFAAVRGGRHLGVLTEAFLAGLAEVGRDWSQLCWATFGHRLREHVVASLAMEGQWVALAGPQSRRLFAKQSVDLPGSVAFVPDEAPGRGWLRAGWHQGVATGDRWRLVDPRVDEEGRLRPLTTVEVVAVGRNRAEVEFDAPGLELRPGTPAIVLALHERMPVEVDDPALHEPLASSAWSCRAAPEGPAALARVRREADVWIVEASDASSLPARVPDLDRVLALLDDRARIHALLRCLAAGQATDGAPTLRWSLVEQPDAPLPESGATLHVGDRIRIDLALAPGGPPFNWFASVVLVDPAGRPRLLTTRMPEGLELAPGDREVVGVRVGRRGVQGIELRWPAEVEGDEGPASLLLLTSRRPIELAHLVRPQASDEDDALALQGLAGDTLRDRKPEHTRGCAWARIDFRLRRTRSS